MVGVGVVVGVEVEVGVVVVVGVGVEVGVVVEVGVEVGVVVEVVMRLVTIVGVGALGSHLVQLLRNEDVTIEIVDHDRVEQKNLTSQLHTRQHVGKLKVEALKQLMQFLWGYKLQVVPHRLTYENGRQLLDGSDLVVDCTDNAEARHLMRCFALIEHVPLIHGALAAGGEFGRVGWYPEFKVDSEVWAGAATCEDGRFLPMIVTVSSYLAKAVQTYLATGKQLSFQVSPVSAVRVG